MTTAIQSALQSSLLQATAGAIGSGTANAVVFPLSLVTTKLQTTTPKARKNLRRPVVLFTLLRLLSRNGLASLYHGLPADTLSTLLSSFLYFYLYTLSTKLLQLRHRMTAKASQSGKVQPLGAIEELAVGLAAGILSKAITLPVSNISVRQQAGSDDDEGGDSKAGRGMMAIAREMFADNPASFWAGLQPSIPLAFTPALSLYLDHLLLRLLVPAQRRAHPPGAVTFALGALSSALATLPLYPLMLMKTLSQSRSGSPSLVSQARGIYSTKGLSGLYQGLEGQLSKALVQQGVTLLVKQRVEEAIMRASRK